MSKRTTTPTLIKRLPPEIAEFLAEPTLDIFELRDAAERIILAGRSEEIVRVIWTEKQARKKKPKKPPVFRFHASFIPPKGATEELLVKSLFVRIVEGEEWRRSQPSAYVLSFLLLDLVVSDSYRPAREGEKK